MEHLQWFPSQSAFMGSHRTQKPICLLAEPTCERSRRVQHKNVLRTSGRSCGEQSSRSQAGRLVAFEVRINPPMQHSSRSES